MRIHHRAALPGHEQAILAQQPELDSLMEMVIEAWRDLGTERPLGFGVLGPIPYTAILTWARFNRLDRELTEMLIPVIQRLDSDRAEREAAKRALKDGS